MSNYYRPCIYFLIDGKEIVYIGKTIHPTQRISAHKKDKQFTSVRYMDCPVESLLYYEMRWIRLFRPKFNKFIKAEGKVLKHKPFDLRLPNDLFKKIKIASKKKDRSINKEIVNALKRVYK